MRELLLHAVDIAEKGMTLEAQGLWLRAAEQYDRAAALYVEARSPGDASEMWRRAETCRRAAPLVTA